MCFHKSKGIKQTLVVFRTYELIVDFEHLKFPDEVTAILQES